MPRPRGGGTWRDVTESDPEHPDGKGEWREFFAWDGGSVRLSYAGGRGYWRRWECRLCCSLVTEYGVSSHAEWHLNEGHIRAPKEATDAKA